MAAGLRVSFLSARALHHLLPAQRRAHNGPIVGIDVLTSLRARLGASTAFGGGRARPGPFCRPSRFDVSFLSANLPAALGRISGCMPSIGRVMDESAPGFFLYSLQMRVCEVVGF